MGNHAVLHSGVAWLIAFPAHLPARPSVPCAGPTRALALIKKHGSIEKASREVGAASMSRCWAGLAEDACSWAMAA